MTESTDREEVVRGYRAAIEKNYVDQEAFGVYAQRRDRNEAELERLRDQKDRSDQDEDEMRAQYEECGCESVTGLSADGFRHKVAEEQRAREVEELREKKRAEIAAEMEQSNAKSNCL